MPAWGLQQGFGLSRCPVFNTQTQNAMHFFIYIFLWEGEKGVYKKIFEEISYVNHLITEPEEELFDYPFLQVQIPAASPKH